MSTHTPGPWMVQPHECEAYGDPLYVKWSVHSEWLTVASVVGDVAELNHEANARLIAAAPELLKELEHLAALLHPWIESGHSVPGIATLNGAWAAIAKARGEA